MSEEQKDGEKYTQLDVLQEYEFAKTSVIAGNVHSVELIALKPIAENLGLSWSAVQQKLKSDEKLSQLSVSAKMVSADNNKRDMLCLPYKAFQQWLWDLDPNENMKLDLWEFYKKDLVIDLLSMIRLAVDEITRLQHISEEYVILKNVVTQYINANEEGKKMTKQAKEYFKKSNILQKSIIDRMDNVNLGQAKLF